ncbi:MAG: hypothetical protein JNK72_26220 [Myxococcales bacterium]|nr:hypothetical protein [Myxococcales bacterium]
MQQILVYANNHIDPPWSYVIMLGFTVFALAALYFAFQQRSLARRAEAEAEQMQHAQQPLKQGMGFVAGQVELARGETLALDVTVTQHGTESHTKNGTFHQWNEKARQVRARPFYLRHPSGARVRVEPGQQVVLIDRLSQRAWVEPAVRRMRASLAPGSFVLVEGTLSTGHDPENAAAQGGYRDGALGWSMVPRPDGSMEVCCEPPARRHALRARGLGRSLKWAALTMILGLAPAVGFFSRLVLGSDESLYLQRTATWTTRSRRGGTAHHYGMYVTRPRGGWANERYELDEDDYVRLEQLSGPAEVWMRVVPDSPALTSPGQGTSVHVGVAAFLGLMTALGWGVVMTGHNYRRWYHPGAAKHHGKGPLGMPTGERFADETGHAPPYGHAPMGPG